MLMSSSKSFLFSNEARLNSGVRLLLELYCVIVIKHVAFFTMNFYTSISGCGCGFGFEQTFLGKKRHPS